MANIKAIDAYVDVIEDTSKPEGYRFETSDLPMNPGNVLVFNSVIKGQDFHIYYRLRGFDGYVFPSDPKEPGKADKANAMWVTKDEMACPQEESKWGQFEEDELHDSGRTLRVVNKNGSKQDFFYTLRITNDGGQTYKEIDPGGSNQNGGNPPVERQSKD